MRTIMNRQARNNFSRGRGVFSCETCGRQTRGTNESLDSKCCGECYEIAGYENMFSDDGPENFDPRSWTHLEELLVKLEGHGVSRAKIMEDDWSGMWAAMPKTEAAASAPETIVSETAFSSVRGGTLLNLCFNAKGDVTLYVNGKKWMRGTEQDARNTGNGFGDGRWGVVYDRRK